MDVQSTELVKATASGVAEGTTTAFLNTLLGPLVEAADSWRDRVRLRRWKAEVLMLTEAEQFLVEGGIDPRHVPAKILFPLLDCASREDPNDAEMITRWAALLANAAGGSERGAAVLPSFPRILSELSPEEAAYGRALGAGQTQPYPERLKDSAPQRVSSDLSRRAATCDA